MLIEPALASSDASAAPRSASAIGCARSSSRTARSPRSTSASDAIALDARRSRHPRGAADGRAGAAARPAGADAFRAIVNAHFRLEPPADFPPMIGVINGTAEWLFSLSRTGCRSRSAARTGCSTSRARNSPQRSGTRSRQLPGCRPTAAVADRARAARDFRGHAGGKRQAPRCRHEVHQSLPCGRLDRHGLARDHRRCHSLRQPGSRFGAAHLSKQDNR